PFAPVVFYGPGGKPDGVAVCYFNGDNNTDLAVTNYSGSNVAILLGNGDGTFGAANTFAIGTSNPRGIVTADFNGDGKLDLAMADETNPDLSVLMGNGDGTFGTPTTYGFNYY